jgi:hypothetical protein
MKNLKSYLTTNFIFSGISGILILSFNESFLMDYLGLTNSSILYFIGAGLIFFSALIYYVIKYRFSDNKLIYIISILDSLWVLGSFAITFFDLYNIKSQSYPLINIVALWIGFLATGQFYYLNKRKLN